MGGMTQLARWFDRSTYNPQQVHPSRVGRILALLIYVAVYTPVVILYASIFIELTGNDMAGGVLGATAGVVLLIAHGVINGNRIVT